MGSPRNPPLLMSEWPPNAINGGTVGDGHFNQLEVRDQVNAVIEAFCAIMAEPGLVQPRRALAERLADGYSRA
jgi:hypothetical protein